MNSKTQWGIAGMGVMGTSLSRNFAQKGIPLALFNRRVEGVEEQVALKKIKKYPELNQAQAFEDLKDYKKSFFYLESGNKLKNKIHKYNTAIDDQLFTNILNTFKDFNFKKIEEEHNKEK